MKKICLILTGGTFGMQSEAGAALKVAEIENRLFDLVPEIKTLAEIKIESVFSIDSSNIQPSHWIILAETIEKNIYDYDGFVIIHGTDTMAYTASALSFMLSGLTKPVILTGSQRPLTEIRSDARINLINSIELATLDIPEVCICFNNVLLRGNRAKKISINDFDAYQSPNFKPLAEIGIKIQLSDEIWRSQGMFQILKKFDHSIMSFALFPGLNPKDLEILIQSSVRGIIFEGFGAGNVPILDNSFIPLIEKLTENKKIVAIKSQCVNGSTDLSLYEGGSRALEAGAISCGDMTREAAIVKMMFLFGNFNNFSLIKENFCRSLIGELTIEDE